MTLVDASKNGNAIQLFNEAHYLNTWKCVIIRFFRKLSIMRFVVINRLTVTLFRKHSIS